MKASELRQLGLQNLALVERDTLPDWDIEVLRLANEVGADHVVEQRFKQNSLKLPRAPVQSNEGLSRGARRKSESLSLGRSAGVSPAVARASCPHPLQLVSGLDRLLIQRAS
jgi:hypothetical protein